MAKREVADILKDAEENEKEGLAFIAKFFNGGMIPTEADALAFEQILKKYDELAIEALTKALK